MDYKNLIFFFKKFQDSLQVHFQSRTKAYLKEWKNMNSKLLLLIVQELQKINLEKNH